MKPISKEMIDSAVIVLYGDSAKLPAASHKQSTTPFATATLSGCFINSVITKSGQGSFCWN